MIKIIISEKPTTIKNPISKYSSADSGSEWETEEELDDSGIKIEDDLDDSGVKFEDAEVIHVTSFSSNLYYSNVS